MEPKENKEKGLTVQEKSISDVVLNRVNELQKEGGLQIPQNYSAANALKSAYLVLQETVDKDHKPVLQSCSKESIANTLLDMVVQGLSPAKKQCYFVAYGGKLTLMRSYMGTVAVTKRLKEVKDVKAYVIYDGDEFEETYDINTATLNITKYVPKFENIDITKIKGAFAVIIGENGPIYTEVMNINQIRKAWGQGASKGNSGAHTNFTDQMCRKSVINRACKMYANTSDDSDILIQTFNKTEEREYDEKDMVDNVDYEVKEEINDKGNSKEIDIKDTESLNTQETAGEGEKAEQTTIPGTKGKIPF